APLSRARCTVRPARGSASSGASGSRSTVPTGTRTTASPPSAPVRWLPPPLPPCSARISGWHFGPRSGARPGSATNTTSPPLPPSPPAGPPRGTYFSRRQATAPSPPAPALTLTTASSMNCSLIASSVGGLGGLDAGHDAALGAPVVDDAVCGGEE